MKDSARYVKIVEWSEDDQCYLDSLSLAYFNGNRT